MRDIIRQNIRPRIQKLEPSSRCVRFLKCWEPWLVTASPTQTKMQAWAALWDDVYRLADEIQQVLPWTPNQAQLDALICAVHYCGISQFMHYGCHRLLSSELPNQMLVIPTSCLDRRLAEIRMFLTRRSTAIILYELTPKRIDYDRSNNRSATTSTKRRATARSKKTRD